MKNLLRLLPSDILPVYLDIQSSAANTDEASFCQAIARAIHRDARSQGLSLLQPPKRKDFQENGHYIVLEEWLDAALEKLEERRILLSIDEFEKIGCAIQERRFSLRLLDQLRHLIQHYDTLGFLFSGVQTLDELGPNWSSYFISVVPIEMTYLEPAEAEDLLRNPDPDFELQYAEGIVDRLLHLTRGHPYLLQLLGWCLVNEANEARTRIATEELLERAIAAAFTNGLPYFNNLWEEYVGIDPETVRAGRQLLRDIAAGRSIDPTPRPHRLALQRMLRYHILEETKSCYRFEVPLVERWVRNCAPADD